MHFLKLICGFNIDLELYLKIHGKQKSFQCEYCEQEFYLNWRLSKHSNIVITSTTI